MAKASSAKAEKNRLPAIKKMTASKAVNFEKNRRSKKRKKVYFGFFSRFCGFLRNGDLSAFFEKKVGFA